MLVNGYQLILLFIFYDAYSNELNLNHLKIIDLLALRFLSIILKFSHWLDV